MQNLSKGWIIGGIIAAIVLFFGISAISIYTSTRNEGRSQEIAMSKQWNDMQANYGQFRLTVADQLGIAREKRDAINKIMIDAITGRYDKGNGAVDRDALFSAIHEAYPDLKGLDIFDIIMTTIQAGRERFAKDQEKMQDMIRAYDTWRTTGAWYHPTVVDWCGFPSPLLKARVGKDKVLTGQEALDKMSTAIIGGDTRQIFETGEDKPVTGK